MDDALQVLHGSVDSVAYANEDTGFTVFQLATKDELFTVVGELLGIAVGEEVKVTGKFVSHPTFGQQFKAEIYERTLPATATAIRKYLSSGIVKGLGAKTAAAIVDMFGDDTLKVIEHEPQRLSQVKGVSEKKAQDITEQYKHVFGIRSVMLYLTKYNIEPAAAIRVWKQWGLLAVSVIEENAYQLCCDAVGISFEHADIIALELGMLSTDTRRLKAGIIYVLTHNLLNGHTCLPQDKLIKTAMDLLSCDKTMLEDALNCAIEDSDLIRDTVNDNAFIYLPVFYEAETFIAGRIILMLQNTCPEKKSYASKIDLLEKRLNISYASMQRNAIEIGLQSQAFILTGGPGTGKTTTLNALLTLLEENGEKVALAAPTGRAAKRMSEVTGREAKTIHRLLEVDFRDKSDRHSFKRDEKNPLRYTAVILDEASMVDTRLMHSLMKALKLSCKLILVGDPDQLPSVGAGNILGDLIKSDAVPTIQLKEIFRQAQLSRIVESAHQIVRGEMPNLKAREGDFFFMQQASYENTLKTLSELCETRLTKAYGFSSKWDIQVISPSRIGALGTVELNRALQRVLNPPNLALTEYKFGNIILRQGDKVMQVRNNYDIIWKKETGEDGTGVFNGDIGLIEMIDRPSQTILIKYDDRLAQYTFDMVHEIEHAYAITVHKSQGSEFEAVIMPLMSYHSKLHYRNLLYTGVTRAKKIMIILGQPQTVQKMIENNRKILRYTNLKFFVSELNNKSIY